MARSVKAVRDWLAFLNSEDSVAVYGQGSGAALVHCEGSNFMQIGGEVREKRERYDRQPLQLAISKLRALVAEPEENAIGSVDTVRELEAILECLEDGEVPCAAANAPVSGPSADPVTKTCWQCRGTGASRFQDAHGNCGVCHGALVVPNDYNPQSPRRV